MDVSALWGLGTTTTVCVTAFVLVVGLLWMYVMLARPSSSTGDYERLEELLSDEGKKATAKPNVGRKEQRKGKGKGRTVSQQLHSLLVLHGALLMEFIQL